MSELNGTIIKSISGFYFVQAADVVYECKAKGAFRKKNITPLVGDEVIIDVNGENGTITQILPRNNFLIRPPIANVDILFIISSVDEPKPNLYVIDKLSAFAVYHNIEPVIVFSKCDLDSAEEYKRIYDKSGMKTICCSAKDSFGIDEIISVIGSKKTVFTGNSGVGKSSILNAICPELKLETNEISSKLGRGKHTTRTVSLYKIADGYIADTPGFSSFDLERITERIFKDELPSCFPDIDTYTENCFFKSSCSHVNDKGCAVVAAVNDNLIAKERHNSYIRMYTEVKDFKKWD